MAGVQLLTLHTLLDHVQQVHDLHFRHGGGLGGVVQAGQLQDIVHQLDHPAGFAMDLLGKTGHILRLGDAGLDQFRIPGNAGQRGLELVAHIGGEILPHLLVVFPQDAVGMDALGKGDQFLVRDLILNVVQILGHVQHRLHKGAGEQGGQDRGSQHQGNAAQHDGRQGSVVDRPHRFGVLRHAQDVAAGQLHGIIIGLISHGLGITNVLADAALQRLHDLRTGKMVLHGLIGGRLKDHVAVRGDQRNAQVAGHKERKLLRLAGQIIPGTDEIALFF